MTRPTPRRLLLLALTLGMLLPGILAAQPAAAQSDGDALCAEALAAAQAGATHFQGYEIVWGSGGSGIQVVLGTDGPDVLSGGSGNDLLCGFGGDDTLYGGSGNDILAGGPGVDQLYGESGGDTLYGDAFDPVLNGGTGRNQVIVTQPTLMVTFSDLKDSGFCDIFIEAQNGPSNTLLYYEATKVRADGLEIPDRWSNDDDLVTSADGYLLSETPFSGQPGTELVWAAIYVDFSRELIATWEGSIVCGE
ncbi:MAG: hypothetical protein H0V47_11070 [Chloroflexia bacterium]|nr:hypothetical protein [Chloroflexia bacterium]